MKVTYIYHSCFCVELEQTILLFDYFKGELPTFDKEKHIYIFSSHKHHDHFSLSIFELFKEYKNVTYILSNDIKLSDRYLEKEGISLEVKEKIVRIGANQSDKVDSFLIQTLKSTDQGVAFLVEAEGQAIYHAGDLNWWHWNGESKEYNTSMEQKFKKEIEKLKGKQIDLAFVPVDARQEDYFWWGFDYFMSQVNPLIVFPMHFWEDYTVIDRLETIAKERGYKEKLYSVRGDNQEWEIQI